MPKYIYRAKKGPEEIVSGEMEAKSQDQVVDKLNEAGLVAISIAPEHPEETPFVEAGNKRQAFLIKVRVISVNVFTRQLASLVKASVPILKALSLIAQQTDDKVMAGLVSNLAKHIKDGQMLSDAMAKYPLVFNNLYVNMVRSGEKAGALGDVLYNLAEYRYKEMDLKRKIQAAMAYPILMVIVGILTIFIMLTFFLPRLAGLFDSMKQTLPLPTRILMGISVFLSSYWQVILIGVFFILVIFFRVKPGSKKKIFFDFIKLRMPFLKRLVKNGQVARFSGTLGLLLHNGISICEALELSTDILDNDVFKVRLKEVKKEIINQGAVLSSSLKKTGVFPSFALSMILVGEESGKLDGSLKHIADFYEKELEQSIQVMTSLLEPFLILLIGGVVGFIVFAMLMPVFNIGNVVR